MYSMCWCILCNHNIHACGHNEENIKVLKSVNTSQGDRVQIFPVEKLRFLENLLLKYCEESLLTSACPHSGERILLKIMAGAAVTRTEKSVKMGVRIARRSCCRLMLCRHKNKKRRSSILLHEHFLNTD